MVLWGMIDRLVEVSWCCGMGMTAEKAK